MPSSKKYKAKMRANLTDEYVKGILVETQRYAGYTMSSTVIPPFIVELKGAQMALKRLILQGRKLLPPGIHYLRNRKVTRPKKVETERMCRKCHAKKKIEGNFKKRGWVCQGCKDQTLRKCIRDSKAKSREKINDSYVKSVIVSHYDLKVKEIPLGMIDFKREQLMLTRLITRGKHGIAYNGN